MAMVTETDLVTATDTQMNIKMATSGKSALTSSLMPNPDQTIS
jgi:hypothetical protein